MYTELNDAWSFVLAVAVDDVLVREAVHHRLGNQIVRARPDVDHLVVLLALRDQTGRVLLFDLFHFGFGVADDLRFRFRNDEVVRRRSMRPSASTDAKPVYINWSAKITVSFKPTLR